MIREHRFSNPDELAGALASRVADSLRIGLKTRELATLVVSGGETPRPLFRRLRQIDLPVMVSDVGGRIRFWNRKAEELYGYTEPEVLAEPHDRLFPSEARDLASAALQNAIHEQGQGDGCRQRHQCKQQPAQRGVGDRAFGVAQPWLEPGHGSRAPDVAFELRQLRKRHASCHQQ